MYAINTLVAYLEATKFALGTCQSTRVDWWGCLLPHMETKTVLFCELGVVSIAKLHVELE